MHPRYFCGSALRPLTRPGKRGNFRGRSICFYFSHDRRRHDWGDFIGGDGNPAQNGGKLKIDDTKTAVCSL